MFKKVSSFFWNCPLFSGPFNIHASHAFSEPLRPFERSADQVMGANPKLRMNRTIHPGISKPKARKKKWSTDVKSNEKTTTSEVRRKQLTQNGNYTKHYKEAGPLTRKSKILVGTFKKEYIQMKKMLFTKGTSKPFSKQHPRWSPKCGRRTRDAAREARCQANEPKELTLTDLLGTKTWSSVCPGHSPNVASVPYKRPLLCLFQYSTHCLEDTCLQHRSCQSEPLTN